MKKLTKAEEQIMQILWDLGAGFVNDIVARMPEPKPAYNTVSTIVRILEQKKFVGHKAYGRTFEYFPLITKADYSDEYLLHLAQNYFSNSYKAIASLFNSNDNLSLAELEEIRKLVVDKINSQQKGNP